MASHSMDMAKKLGEVMQVSGGTQAGAHISAPQRRPRGGGMESHPQEQASQEGYLHELSSRTQHQRDEIDELRRIITALTNSVHHLERQLEEARMRQERPVQELTMRWDYLCANQSNKHNESISEKTKGGGGRQ